MLYVLMSPYAFLGFNNTNVANLLESEIEFEINFKLSLVGPDATI